MHKLYLFLYTYAFFINFSTDSSNKSQALKAQHSTTQHRTIHSSEFRWPHTNRSRFEIMIFELAAFAIVFHHLINVADACTVRALKTSTSNNWLLTTECDVRLYIVHIHRFVRKFHHRKENGNQFERSSFRMGKWTIAGESSFDGLSSY